MRKAIVIFLVMLSPLYYSYGAPRITELHPYASAVSDAGFKQLMSDLNVAKNLLNAVIDDFREDPIRKLEAAPTALPYLKQDGCKQVFMDFHATTESGLHIIIEMQARRHVMFDERALRYACGVYFQQLSSSGIHDEQWFTHLQPVYAIQILDYDSNEITGSNVLPKKDTLLARVREHPMPEGQYIKDYHMTDKYSRQTINALRMIQIELPRANEVLALEPDQIAAPGEQADIKKWWLSVLKHTRSFTREQVSRAPQEVQDGFKMIEYNRWKRELQEEYNEEMSDWGIYETDVQDRVHTAEEKALAKGLAEGLAEGKMRERLSIAKNMLQSGLDIETVKKFISISDEEISQIQKELEEGTGGEALEPESKRVPNSE